MQTAKDLQPSKDIARLIEIVAALRTPGTGCAWDLQQTHATLAPYALEEAYEVVDAIERGDLEDLCDELGDLLLQVVFHARLGEEVGGFRFEDIVEGVCAKMVRRHPHVFDQVPKRPSPSGVDKIWDAMRQKREARLGPAGKTQAHTPVHGLIAAMAEAGDGKPALSNELWETIKAEERKAKGDAKGGVPVSLLAGVTPALPGLTRAVKLQRKAATVGFDWSDAKLVLAKIREEVDEIEREVDGASREAAEAEIGDLLFAVANLARHLDADPERAVRSANAKFERRFAHIEAALATKGAAAKDTPLDELEALWGEAKAEGL